MTFPLCSGKRLTAFVRRAGFLGEAAFLKTASLLFAPDLTSVAPLFLNCVLLSVFLNMPGVSGNTSRFSLGRNPVLNEIESLLSLVSPPVEP